MNHLETMWEINTDPVQLRQIADQLERAKEQAHQPGQIIRYKVSHNFCVVYKPETAMQGVQAFHTEQEPECRPM
jgi:hypothetical protein